MPASAGQTAMFSNRLPGHAEINALSRAVAAVKAAGTPLVDLTESNPTSVGLPYPADLLAAAGSERALRYDPQPFGLRSAREAVAADYARRGCRSTRRTSCCRRARARPTAGSSSSSAIPATAVLIPQPSYPLFEHLTRLDAVRAVPYRLEYHGRWEIDLDSVAAAPAGCPGAPARLAEQPDRVVCVRAGSRGTRGDRARARLGDRRRRSVRRVRARGAGAGDRDRARRRACSRSRWAVRRSRWVCRRSSWPG